MWAAAAFPVRRLFGGRLRYVPHDIVLPLILLLSLALTCGCRDEQKYTLRDLPSGKKVKVLGVHAVKLGEVSTGLMLQYQTDLEFDDSLAVQREVSDIWTFFKSDVERANLADAIISVNEGRRGFILGHNRTLYYYFKKRADGSWATSKIVYML
jgi:hypothetical protein